jgi:hypothetical protein
MSPNIQLEGSIPKDEEYISISIKSKEDFKQFSFPEIFHEWVENNIYGDNLTHPHVERSFQNIDGYEHVTNKPDFIKLLGFVCSEWDKGVTAYKNRLTREV